MEDADDGGEASKVQPPCFYEQLGAPGLLYRNRETFTVHDDDPRLCNAAKSAAAASFVASQSELYRSAARWYYPIDYHLLPVPKLPPRVHEFCREWTRQSPSTTKIKRPPRTAAQPEAPPDDSSGEESMTLEQQDPSQPRSRLGENDDARSVADVDDTVGGIQANSTSLRDLMREYQEDGEERHNGGIDGADLNRQTPRDHERSRKVASAPTPSPRESETLMLSSKGRSGSSPSEEKSGGEANAGRRVLNPTVTDSANDKKHHENDESSEWSEVQDVDSITNDGPLKVSHKERNANVRKAFKDKAYSAKQIFGLQLKARAHMILSGLDGNDKNVRHQARQKLQAYAQLDANYVPGKVKIKYSQLRGVAQRTRREVPGLTSTARQQTELYDRERTNRADPAYLAPFYLSIVQETCAADVRTRVIPNSSSKMFRAEVPAIPRDDPNAPNLFGNCLLAFPCECQVCQSEVNRLECPVLCLLHPVGPLQDRVRLSFVELPRGRRVAAHDEPRLGIPEELDVGDRVRQLEQAGSDPLVFLARTDLHCTVFSVLFVAPRRETPLGENECWGTADLKQLHRIDCRTMWRSMPSYRPIDVACHPRYGVGDFAPSKVAVTYESNHGERNAVHHLQIGSESITGETHVIANLRDITEIDFSSHHPMVLWASARSYVRPALTLSYMHKRPRIGHGTSLYSVDLRSGDAATFQWSPSAEEFVPEGVHSISGIYTDWSQDHCLWASSISVGKTWEIDTRMPFRAVNSWSLPHTCDQFGSQLPPTGLYGAGVLFSRPRCLFEPRETVNYMHDSSSPILSVGTTPGAFGFHVYNRPASGPRFQTHSIELTSGPGLSKLGKPLFATSSTFHLPDVSDSVFACGLASFRTPLKNFCDPSLLSSQGYADDELREALYSISLTNKGDIYTHLLVESRSSGTESRRSDGLPLGCSAIPAPQSASPSAKPWNVLSINLSNNFPIPSRSVSTVRPKSPAACIHDVTSIIAKLHDGRRLGIRRERLQKRRQLQESLDTSNAADTPSADYNSKFDAPVPDHIESNRSRDGYADVDLDSSSGAGAKTCASIRISKAPLSSAVVSMACGDATHLTLPHHLVPDAEDQRVERFLTGRLPVAVNNSSPEQLRRSDLTPAVLVRSWDELDDDSSQESA